MEQLNFINNTLKYIFISIMTFFIFAKSINYNNITKKQIIISVVTSILLGLLYAFMIGTFPSVIVISILIILISITICLISNLNLGYTITVTFLSMAIGISCFTLSIFVTSIVVQLPFIEFEYQNLLILLISICIEVTIVINLYKIKRFKNGFSFLSNQQKLNTFSIIGLLLSGSMIIIYSVLRNSNNFKLWEIGIIGFALIIIGTFIWIKRNITLDYQDRMKNRKIENLEKELADKEKINAELTEEIKSLTMINHQYNSRIKAAKQEIEKLAFAFKNSTDTEFSTELSEVTKLVNNLSSEYSNKVNSVLKYSKPLPKTNVKGVDSILEHMKLEATKKNIDFDLKVNCSVKHLIEKFISQSELETLISDHVKDAIIAVGYSESTPRSICVIFDIIDNCYRFSVYDSGIDFEIDTLVNLGLDAITTHKDDGGTGLGFLTTFGTLDKCKASLVIDEINFKNSNFSKSVNIIFDGKHEYIVRSSRTEEIKKFDKNSRIILQNKD